ncbi:hypothetical protein [uncultured Desulfobacter sp.]|uniref:hypothetical protein n=1 Tax=uncultured Desulfobacter sp. TaxID=240139 RepID=UPI002AAA71BB|nr:hypothetical protein [uncultured Desulfobacter sp.]
MKNEIFREIKNKFKITVTDLTPPNPTPLNFSVVAETERDLLLKLSSNIPGVHPAIVYNETKITQIYFLPESGKMPLPSFPEKEQPPQKILGAEVTSVPRDNSLPWADIEIGDIIIEYDNVPIEKGPVELTALMKERSENELIEMTVIREGQVLRVFTLGGYIDAGLKTISVKQDTP